MRKLFFALLLPAFLVPQRVISTEQEVELSEEEKYQVSQTIYGAYFTEIPRNPNVYREVLTFKTPELDQLAGKIKPDTPLKIKNLTVNPEEIPIFELANGAYLQADKNLIYEDVVISSQKLAEKRWLEPDFKVYDQPLVNGAKEVKSDLAAYTPVTISKLAQTPRGTYALIEGKGWVDTAYLSESDNRMDKIQTLLSQKYNRENFSIYVKQLDTGRTAGINPDKEMYSASVMKLPVLYYAQEALDEGKYQLSSPLKYTKEVNDYIAAYDTEGSGSLSKEADDKEYSLEDLINRVAKESDNAATNVLGYYVTNKADKAYQDTLTQIVGKNWDVEERLASSRMAGQMMEAIYEQNGRLIEVMSQTNFDDQRISKDIPVKVAHKIGDAYDFKHDVAIVYGSSPFILSIFTDGSDYDTISQIANDVYGVLK